MQSLSASLLIFGDKKQLLKSLLTSTFVPPLLSINKIEEKVHTKAVADVSRGAGGKVFLFSLERQRGAQQKPIVSSNAVLEDLNIKFRSKFNHGFTNRGCLHKAYKARDMQFFLQNVQNKISKILEMFKYKNEFHQSSLLN